MTFGYPSCRSAIPMHRSLSEAKEDSASSLLVHALSWKKTRCGLIYPLGSRRGRRNTPTRYGGPRMRRGGPYAHRSMFATVESHSDGPRVAKNFKNRMGSSAAKNSPTDAVTTADISLTVRAHDHAGLGSPPPKHLGVQSGVGMPSPAVRLPCNSLLALTTVSCAGSSARSAPATVHPADEGAASHRCEFIPRRSAR